MRGRSPLSGLVLAAAAMAAMTPFAPSGQVRHPPKPPRPKPFHAPEGNRAEQRAQRAITRANKKHKLKGLR